jgi:non-specific serine/threonine protein kinase
LLLHDDRRAAALFAEELTIAHRLGDAEHCAGGVQELAAVATAEGQALRAARLYGAACALYEAAGVPPWTLARAVQEQDERRLRSELGDSAFSAAWAEGRAMAREQAIAYALDLDWSARGTARRACPARPRPAPGPASGTRSRGRPRTRRGD